jgi:ribosomal protein S18 acetylase RimI-like enzyme
MATLSAPISHTFSTQPNGARPVNLRTDLGAIADLIELVFERTMDEGGRAAIREMRALSRLGAGLSIIAQLNEMTVGIKMGFVWIEDGKLVGNVSVYPANFPAELGETWIIANVGVHPDYQRRGIARKLMKLSLDMIATRGGQHVILQVDYDNHPAIRLYEQLDFISERAWSTWRRSSIATPPPDLEARFFITRRRPSEWRAEYALAERLRPLERGGLGWLRPLHLQAFKLPFYKQLSAWLSMNSIERLIVRTDDEQSLRACLWVENGLASFNTRLTLLNDPQEPAAAEALLNTVIRRFRTSSLSIEHPEDDEEGVMLLWNYRFNRERSVWHMRLDLH